jgi:2-polyprenyl-3-methyl-5-hydroxy-6-metoxy-1,4-benzoquinol methylase
VADPEFRPDLYQGTAGYYDRFRVPYPPDLIDDLGGRAGADGAGRLLDLACGTGQLSFAVHARFAEVWADDLRRALHASQPDGLFRQTIIFACDLARRPA